MMDHTADDPNHSVLNRYHDDFVKTLTEYVHSRGLNYTSADIEDVSWNGTEQSTQFAAHFSKHATKNGTTADEEIKAWRVRVAHIGRDYGTPKEKNQAQPADTTKTPADTTKQNEN